MTTSTFFSSRVGRRSSDVPASEVAPESHFDKYRDRMAAIGLDRAEYVATDSLAVRITPTRFLGWAGRSHLAERR